MRTHHINNLPSSTKHRRGLPRSLATCSNPVRVAVCLPSINLSTAQATVASILLLSWFIIGGAGCNSEPILSDSTITNPDLAFVFVFEDDADPAVASLDFVQDELLIQPFPGANPLALAALYRDLGVSVSGASGEIGLTVLTIESGSHKQIAQTIAKSRLVESIHKNYEYVPSMLPDDPFFSEQDYLEVAGVVEAWSLTTGSADIITAIVDTGADPTHPDLVDKIIDGWNVFDNNADFSDSAGHGTRVAGVLAAAGNNGLGVSGVARDNPLLVIRATNAEGKGTSRHIAAGILWAVSRGAKVINVSFAPLWSNRVVQAAAEKAFNQGALVVISAGNGGGFSQAQGYEQSLFVGALSDSTQIASFSDQGPFVDLAAPGTDIRTTSIGGQYAFADGTSFAAPIVSGIAALAWSVNPDLRPATISRLIISNAIDLGVAGDDDVFGRGAINAADVVTQASRTAFLPDNSPPIVQIESPSDGATLSGREFVTINATDPWGVADVVMSIGGVAHATDTLPPYRFLVDTNDFEAGQYNIDFIATDLAGNRSAPVSMVLNLTPEASNTGGSTIPSVSISSPSSGSQVSGQVSIDATAKSSVGLAVVEWFVDGELIAVDTLSGQSSGINFLWRSSAENTGTHTITATITDNAGTSASTSVSLITR